ncbi:MAG: endonuclease/exonuclease/phosphatase family protein, partial [Gemmataceae bacterium]
FERISPDGTNPTLHRMPSKHCVMTLTHTLPDGQTQRLTLVNCHLKAGSGSSNEGQRKKQARVVSGFVKKTLAADPNGGVIVLGDLNASRRFDATSAGDAVGVIRGLETADPLDDLVDLNGNLAADKRVSHAGGGELDRILLSGGLLDDVGFVFRQVVVRRDLITDDESDHFPMVATFTFRKAVGP